MDYSTIKPFRMEKKLSCTDAKKIDLVEFLAKLGYRPEKLRNDDSWYKSPLRGENTASFKVSKKLNCWFDFGTGQGGNLIDFGVLYFRCTVSELLQKLQGMGFGPTLSFHQPISAFSALAALAGQEAGEKKTERPGKLIVLEVGPLTSGQLVEYCEKRCIPLKIAHAYCKEVSFELYGKRHSAIGFKNNAGGYELRCDNFKGSSSPKAPTFINNGSQVVAVFEGVFSFLSFQIMIQDQKPALTNFLVLNSLSFFQSARLTMDAHQQVHLYLDRDPPGQKHALQAIQRAQERYIDKSQIYVGFKDFNEYLVNRNTKHQQVARRGLRA
ncbi:toprim domain-containing protein [Paraflavitalea sp. CAU 1676]|uniref:toprim domain-containing protein n=1 Tax=Paraflavitalea sp. CAU 1676 TaxID=3032598 RepID=UPI0023DAD244|nr:toprim domain-containing protein [Paraflavitalea sp. CAU 1676]MDF2188309.1 toprim domain-containing protein [Paraflavitalea sp. CAU 1676]